MDYGYGRVNSSRTTHERNAKDALKAAKDAAARYGVTYEMRVNGMALFRCPPPKVVDGLWKHSECVKVNLKRKRKPKAKPTLHGLARKTRRRKRR